MSVPFTPVAVVTTNEKDWAYKLGMMDWDDTNIVFTKRSLIDFLKYTGVTVDTNLSSIQKLPRYAHFGKLPGEHVSAATAAAQGNTPASATTSQSVPSEATAVAGAFKPSRRVRTAPGGPQTISLFGEEDEDETHPTAKNGRTTSVEHEPTSQAPEETEQAPVPAGYRVIDNDGNDFIPTRRVRTNPGGHDSLTNMFTDDSAPEEFKPTRKVRERPGGVDNVEGLY